MIDVDKLQAGPELDALVAEKVMGWKVGPLSPSRPQERCVDLELWAPSRDIATAWEVVEKVRAARFNLLLDMTWGHSGILAFARERIHEVKVEGGSIPLAICRAALKAVGV